MKKSFGIPLYFACLLLALPGHAAERDWLPYRKLVDTIELDKFDKPARPTIKSAGSDQRYASDAKNQLKLKLDEDILKENPLVEWSARPIEAEIDD